MKLLKSTKAIEVEKEKLMEDKKEYQRTLQHLQAQLEKAHEQFRSNWYQEKTRGL